MDIKKIFPGVTHVERNCADHGIYLAMISPAKVEGMCPSCYEQKMLDEKARDVIGIIKSNQDAILHNAMASMGIPPRFKNKTLQNYVVNDPRQAQILRAARKYADEFPIQDGRAISFIGNPGCGKTHFAVGLAMAAYNKGASVKFTTMSGMMDRIKESRRPNAEKTYLEMIKTYCEPDLLVVDDVGTRLETEADKGITNDVFNGRYEEGKSIVITSNLDISELVVSVGSRVVSRLQDNGGVFLFCDWDSYRAGASA